MKSMSEISGGNNWLGFSLSPHMKMEAVVTSAPVSSSPVPTGYVLSSFLSPHNGMCSYGGESISTDSGISGEGFQYSVVAAAAPPPLSVMPLKSDGSLCIMEALSRSHPQGTIKKPGIYLGKLLSFRVFIKLVNFWCFPQGS